MEKGQLKTLIDRGGYRPEPARIAEAMLEHRGVRELLTAGMSTDGNGGVSLNGAGRIQSPSAARRQAA